MISRRETPGEDLPLGPVTGTQSDDDGSTHIGENTDLKGHKTGTMLIKTY